MKGLILGFDTETDPFEYTDYYSKKAMKKSINSLRKIRERLEEFDAPATFFLMGRLIEESPAEFREVLGGMPQFEIASHTYSHIQMKSFPHAPCKNTVAKIRRDVEKGLEVVRKIFDVDDIDGLCVPANYYKGLQDRQDLQEMLLKARFKYICSDGRGPRETIPAPFTQPYWYKKHKLLEIPHTGWHCNMINCLMGDLTLWPPLPSTVLPSKKIENITELLDVYRREFDYACKNNLYYAPCLHPWSLFRYDPEIRVIRSLLKWSREKNVPVMTYREVYKIYENKRIKR